ncbi:MAG: CHAT domain-containing protein, partial [Vicinamibacteria bacterium]
EAEAAGRASARLLAGYRAAALELRRLVWDPVAPDVMGASTVFLVPDGALHLVNVSALPDGDHGYLLETGPTIHYLAAERDLAMPARTSRAGGLLAVGNPRFDDGATPVSSSPRLRSALCGGLGGLHFGPLAASARESEEVAALWTGRHGGATVLSETAATEAAFKAQAAGHRVLHLATHGYFLDEDCDVAGEAATPADGAAATGALLRAGLAFAGANQRAGALASDDDGVVTAAEVASLDLSGVEWAVLSACDTGLGSIATGEGVFGLQRAFRVAGASTVIMSLWPVDDEATRAWMTRLYRARLDEGRDTAAAVRAAALQTLEARRRGGRSTHPFYWAGFIASGDWR